MHLHWETSHPEGYRSESWEEIKKKSGTSYDRLLSTDKYIRISKWGNMQ